ncbi:hypothetical protein LCGC14_2926640 [marine sediment metagenome]|uniref:Uncharacterized protein n=1 Tax=marine sediment metagenome TaxID=412755 RepID=A0A0F8Y8Z4_9ZZZZ
MSGPRVTEEFNRPWCCPEPRCRLVWNYQVGAAPTPGDSFVCFGEMAEPVAFTYDGSEHVNDLNHCDYTPLKGVIRWQENEDDWVAAQRFYATALRKLKAGRE